jgi:hypothetical protein
MRRSFAEAQRSWTRSKMRKKSSDSSDKNTKTDEPTTSRPVVMLTWLRAEMAR